MATDGGGDAGVGSPPRAGRLRRWRWPAIGLLGLLACAVTVVVILLTASSSESPPPAGQRSTTLAGQLLDGELAPVPYNHVNGVGDTVVRLNGTLATVSVNTTGLLNGTHAMHFHAGGRGLCPPGSAARGHDGHLAISTTDGVPWYGNPVTSLTTRGDTSPKSFLAFKRYMTGSDLHYTRRIRVSKVVAAEIRTNNAVVVVHGIDYNRNGFYDFAALDRSELAKRLPAEVTAPALCGALVLQKPSGSGGTKTARAPSVGKTQVFTASLTVRREPLPTWLCHLGLPTEGDRTRA